MTEFPTPRPVTVEARLDAGVIELYAEARDTTVVEVSPLNSSGKEAAEQTRIELTGDVLRITPPLYGNWLFRRTPPLRVLARIPEGSDVSLRCTTADVRCVGRFGMVRLHTAAGDLDVDEVTGDLVVNSATGDVTADRVGGRLVVHTASGDVTARRVDGTVEVRAASADIEITELGGDLSSTSASGSLRVGTAWRGTIRATAASGDLTIGVRPGVRVWMDLYTVTGDVRNELASVGDEAPTGEVLTLHLRSLTGDVAVHRSAPQTD